MKEVNVECPAQKGARDNGGVEIKDDGSEGGIGKGGIIEFEDARNEGGKGGGICKGGIIEVKDDENEEGR